MPNITINGVNYHYTDTQSEKEAIVFAHGLLWSGWMFHKQVDFFKDRYRVITYDHRGQGQTETTESGYDMDTLYGDAIELIKRLCPNQKVNFVGLSMGGFIAMRLAARKPELLKSLILMETSADAESAENVPKYRKLNKIVKWIGTWAVVGKVMPIMFGQRFLNEPLRKIERKECERQMRLCKAPGVVRAVDGVIDRISIFEEISKITIPTLIMVGTQDVATVPAKAERMHNQIKNSKLIYIDGAGHSASLEEPEQVNNAIEAFLKEN